MGSVIKKRGRPLGSKNKPKRIRILKVEADLARKMGIPVEQYAKEKVKIATKAPVKKVNWERLAKQLQTALNDEIKENQGLSERINNLQFQVANLEHQAIGYRAVVSYLENQIANNPV